MPHCCGVSGMEAKIIPAFNKMRGKPGYDSCVEGAASALKDLRKAAFCCSHIHIPLTFLLAF